MAAKEGRELVKEAVKDAKSLKEAAIAAAKNELVESMAPQLRALLEKEIKGALGEKRGLTGRIGMSQRGDYFSDKDQKWEEGKERGEHPMADKDDKEKLDLESLAGFFPQLAEDPGAEEVPEDEGAMPPMGGMSAGGGGMGMPHEMADAEGEDEESAEGEKPDHVEEDPSFEGIIPQLGEDADAPVAEAKGKEKEDMDEEIEISEAELKKVYEAALQTEAQVSKGFKDVVGGGELDQASKETGILDKKSGEKPWEQEVPPEHVDYQVKESIKRGLAENKMLRAKLTEAVRLIRLLGGKLHETNLFNAKVLHVNRILNTNARLTKEQKKVVLESIDKARTIDEVKMVFEAITNSFKAASLVTESRARKPVANAQGVRKSGQPDQKVLSESVDRGEKAKFGRLQELAGLLK